MNIEGLLHGEYPKESLAKLIAEAAEHNRRVYGRATGATGATEAVKRKTRTKIKTGELLFA